MRAEIHDMEMKKMIEKINEIKSLFLEKMNKIDKKISQTYQEKKREDSNQ